MYMYICATEIIKDISFIKVSDKISSQNVFVTMQIYKCKKLNMKILNSQI